MYFGKFDLKSLILLLANTVLILLVNVAIVNTESVGSNDVLMANGYIKDKVGNFNCYVKEISSTNNNLHTLTYIQYIPDIQVEQGNIEDYHVGIKVTCGDKSNGKTYVIYDRYVDDRHKHCDLCHRYIGNELIRTFNDKKDVQLQEIKTNAGVVFIEKITLGVSCFIYIIAILFMFMSTGIRYIKERQYSSDDVFKNFRKILKTFSVWFCFIMIVTAFRMFLSY